MELRFNGLKLIIIRHLSKRKAPWSESRGPDRFRSQSRRLRLTATGRSSGPLDFCQHGAGLFAGAGVDVVVAEEDLRGGGVGEAVFGHVVGVDVDGGIGGFLNELDAGGLAVGAGDTVGLAFGGLDHQEDAAVVGEGLVQFEGEGLTLAYDGGAGGVLHTDELGRSHGGLAAAGDDPVVETGEQVGAADLGLGAQDAAAFLREGQFVPGEDVVSSSLYYRVQFLYCQLLLRPLSASGPLLAYSRSQYLLS